MPRIIVDSFDKVEKKKWSLEPENPKNQEFNRKISAGKGCCINEN